MTTTTTILLLALGTFLLRFVPMAALSRVALPAWAEDWLRLVPGAVLAASLAQALLYPEGSLWLSMRNPYLLATVPTALVAWRTRSVIFTMVAGLAFFALANALL